MGRNDKVIQIQERRNTDVIIRNNYSNNRDMEMLTIIFALASAIGAGLVVWSKTKAGQKWLERL